MRKLYHIDKTKSDWREKWLIVRKKSIGASDSAAILGLNSYSSPLSVYLDKKNLIPEDDEENIAAELGLELENFMRRKFIKWMVKNEDLDITVKEVPYILQHNNIDFFTTTLDGIFKHPVKDKCILEIKTTTEFNREQWKDDEVPDKFYIQVQHQLMVTGWHWVYLIYLIGNRSIGVKIIERNEEVIKKMAKIDKDFWINFVEKNIPPAPIGLDSDNKALKILYPNETPKVGIELTGKEEAEIILMMGIVDKQKEIEKIAKKENERAKQIIKAKIGVNEYMIANGRKITFKTIEKEAYTVKGSSYRKLHIGKK